MPRFSPTERLGINAVEGIFLNDFKWIPRSQESSDMGIDSQVEVCAEGNPTGKLLALQVKSGASFFQESSRNCVVVRGKRVHYEYWLNHSLPVLLIVHNPETGETLWQHLSKNSLVLLKQGWKTQIDRNHRLTAECRDEIADIAEGPEHLKRLRRLQLDKPLIRRLADGDTLHLEFEKWVNKSLGRTPLTLKARTVSGTERVVRETFLYYVGFMEDMLHTSFPWADCEIDGDYYDGNMDEDTVEATFGIREFWDEIYPYTVAMGGEVASYRVVLKLNVLGTSFLVLDEYLSQ
jgi:hypothetical protein